MGIEQLNFKSIQLGYLKILQMGNTDPKITGTHGNGDRPAEPPLCPDWLPEDPANGAIKDRIARPASQMAYQLSLYTLHSKPAGGNHRSAIFRTRQPITARWSSDTTSQSVTTPMIALDFSGTTTQPASQNVALNQISRKSLTKSRNQLKNYRVPLDGEFEQLRDPLQGRSTASTGYQYKEQVSGIAPPPKSLKSSAENGGNLRIRATSRSSPRSFYSLNWAQQRVDVFSKEHQNETVPTNSNDVAELHQLTTYISCEATQKLVTDLYKNPSVDWLRKTSQNDDASTNPNDAVTVT
ncbi:hypothetical protein F511_34973 [Dorcoceras hygrometricum]|uniref:Uncharacterized protein n=1 Tax=Dorcoceras hygrometricum TaxID=472368 RepID=A0A2Z7B5U6_9LAMI|nr:hypothetical protein F511_34973 [Dorcoceras hygrometricum]